MERQLYQLIAEARAELALLKGYAAGLPNPSLLISPAVIRESIASSAIENINTTVAEALQASVLNEKEPRKSDEEVLRYGTALRVGVRLTQAEGVPLSSRVICAVHEALLPHGGQYKRVPNKIENSATGEIMYTPPGPEHVQELIWDWEAYVNTPPPGQDPLVRCALAHYQFEAIHPFGDGNGRTGRILLVLQLLQDGLLDTPILFLSGYINRNKAAYYQALRGVSQTGDWQAYLTYLLTAVRIQAIQTTELIKNLNQLHEETVVRVRHLGFRSPLELVRTLFAYPVITPSLLSRELQLHWQTAAKWLEKLRPELLTDRTVGKHHLYFFQALIELLQQGL